MAIGSAPEIGVEFTVWGKMSESSRIEWYRHVRDNWKDNLLKGYATHHYAPRGADNPYADL
jgi:hypothetical protein